MDSGSKTLSSGELKPKAKVSVDLGSTQVYNKTVRLRSRVSARLEYRGQETGKLYQWNKAGDVVEVEEADSGILLAKRRGTKSCCGNSKDGNAIFELA